MYTYMPEYTHTYKQTCIHPSTNKTYIKYSHNNLHTHTRTSIYTHNHAYTDTDAHIQSSLNIIVEVYIWFSHSLTHMCEQLAQTHHSTVEDYSKRNFQQMRINDVCEFTWAKRSTCITPQAQEQLSFLKSSQRKILLSLFYLCAQKARLNQ